MTILFKPLFIKLKEYPLFQQKPLENPWQVIVWWEKRRFVYNLAVGLVGLGSSIMIVAVGALAEKMTGVPYGLCDPPIFMVFFAVLYGLLANICYTMGWMAQILSKKIWEKKAESFGEISFAFGFVFSIFLTAGIGLLISGISLVLIFFNPYHP